MLCTLLIFQLEYSKQHKKDFFMQETLCETLIGFLGCKISLITNFHNAKDDPFELIIYYNYDLVFNLSILNNQTIKTIDKSKIVKRSATKAYLL